MRDLYDFDVYAEHAMTTAVYPRTSFTEGLSYAALGLNGEAGEVADGVKKMLRDDGGKMSFGREAALVAELGDVLWYVAAMCRELGVPMSDVANHNLEKLRERKASGQLQAGDRR